MTIKDSHFNFLVRINLSTETLFTELNFCRKKIVIILQNTERSETGKNGGPEKNVRYLYQASGNSTKTEHYEEVKYINYVCFDGTYYLWSKFNL